MFGDSLDGFSGRGAGAGFDSMDDGTDFDSFGDGGYEPMMTRGKGAWGPGSGYAGKEPMERGRRGRGSR